MTINLGTSSITTTYSYEARSNSYQSSNYGTLLMNNSQATYLFNGSYFRNYAETPWERIITNRSDSNNITFTDYGDIGSLIQKGNGKIRLQQTSRNNGGPHGNNLSKIGYAEIKNSADFTGNVSFTTLKLQGNGAIYTFGSNYSYSVSETFSTDVDHLTGSRIWACPSHIVKRAINKITFFIIYSLMHQK